MRTNNAIIIDAIIINGVIAIIGGAVWRCADS